MNPSQPSLSQGVMGSVTGFTRLCKGLAAVLALGCSISYSFPFVAEYAALIPGKTIPFAWNLLSAGYFEQSIFGLIVSISGLLFSGKLLEPVWGSKAFLKFIIYVNFLTTIGTFVLMICLYYGTRNEIYLYTPISGFHGVLSGFLVAIKQIMPDQEIFIVKFRAKWLPSLLVVLSVIVGVLSQDWSSFLPFVLFGTYISWLYLRYFQRKSEANLKGDPNDEFSFSTFFPEFLRPVIEPVALVCEKLFCGRAQSLTDEGMEGFDAEFSLPGSDPIEASRRRERGARALEERLGAAIKSGEPNTALTAKSGVSSASVNDSVGADDNV